MIRIDIEADTYLLALVYAVVGGSTSYCFRKSAARASMENPHRLAGPLVNRHRCRKMVVSHIDKFDAQMVGERTPRSFIDFAQV